MLKNPFHHFIFKKYHRLMHEEGFVDFSDFITETIKLFESCPNVLERYRKRYKVRLLSLALNCLQYILVDEFQDTTISQWRIVQLLLGSSGCITVVGDIDQSIYSFRGATLVNLSHFDSLFNTKEQKEKGLITLSQNYRSTKSVYYCFLSTNHHLDH